MLVPQASVLCLYFVPITLKIVLLKYFSAGFKCLSGMRELQREGRGWFVSVSEGEILLRIVLNALCVQLFSFSVFFFFIVFYFIIQEKKEHKRTQRAAAKKLRDRHDANLAHPRSLSLSGDF